jgi:hypothetical protein
MLSNTDKLPPEVEKEDLSQRKASRGQRKAIQDPHHRPQALSTWWARQNINTSPKDILVVRRWNSGPFVLLKNSTFIFIRTFCGSFSSRVLLLNIPLNLLTSRIP